MVKLTCTCSSVNDVACFLVFAIAVPGPEWGILSLIVVIIIFDCYYYDGDVFVMIISGAINSMLTKMIQYS